METAIIILGIVIALQTGVMIILGKQIMSGEKECQTDREDLIAKYIAQREHLIRSFEVERQKLFDKMLKRNGISPINEEQKSENGNEKPKQSLSRR